MFDLIVKTSSEPIHEDAGVGISRAFELKFEERNLFFLRVWKVFTSVVVEEDNHSNAEAADALRNKEVINHRCESRQEEEKAGVDKPVNGENDALYVGLRLVKLAGRLFHSKNPKEALKTPDELESSAKRKEVEGLVRKSVAKHRRQLAVPSYKSVEIMWGPHEDGKVVNVWIGFENVGDCVVSVVAIFPPGNRVALKKVATN